MKSSSIRKKTLALLLMLCMALFALPAFAQEFTVTKTVDLAQELPGTNDERFSAYLEQELYAPIYGDISLFGTNAGNALSAQHKLMYDALKARIEKVANGTSTSTVFTIDPSTIAGLQCTFTAAELGVSDIVVGSSISSAAGSAAIGKFFGNNDELFNALLHDCPLELYWFDKAVADAMGMQASFSSDGVTLTVTSLTVTMQVAKSYQNGSSTKVKAANISSVVSAAQAIVNKYAGKSDKEKLEGYRDEICALTSYNDEAAENTSTPYGDPWQLIYVFDGNPSTTVVCEGYSKSFQYLCDLSSFNNVECYTVSGMMGSEPHMWNIVVMDGVSYLVDVTNSDAGSVGQNGGLFLTNTPAEGNVDTGYLFLVSGQGVHYDYDNESVDLWGKDLLTLGGEVEHVCSFTGEATYRVVDDVQHEAVVHCIGCEKTKTFTENHTISSKATCSSSAFCDLCQVYFGDIDDTNHESNEFYYTVNTFNKLKHDKRHVCCQLIVETTSHEETTPANCQSPAYCAVCDSSYGSKAPNTHALSTYKYVVNSSNPEKHDKVYDCCGKIDKTEAHSYSEATCQAPATCPDCGHTTGDKGKHTMDASGKCTACGTEAAAKFTDAYGTVTYYADYNDLQWAIIYDHSAGTITLLQNETEDNSNGCLNLMSGNSTTLDLNGKTLIYGLVIDEDTDVLIKDSASAKGTLMCGITIYSGSVKIDASADCLGETSGYGAWTIENSSSNPLVIGTDVILPAGIVLEDDAIHYTDGDSLAVDEVYSFHKHEWSGSYSSGESTHWYKCLNCDARKDEAAHNYSAATCQAPATCPDCGHTTGSKGDHVMDANGKCTACGTEAAAKFTDEAYGTVTYYTDYIDLQSAIYNHGAGTITLLKDQTEENSNGTLHLSSGSETTLDINGRTLAYYLVIDKETNVLIKDSVGNGKPKHCIYIYSGILKIDASFDCLSVGDGDETLMIYNNTGAALSVGTDVILPEGILLLGKTHYVVDSIPNEENARCHKHNWETEWFTNDKKHWHGCEGCKTAIDEAAHTGGTATCMDLAECSVCGEAYGSTNPDAHSYTYTVTGGTIVETCANGCTHRAEATLMPPTNLVYDGTAKNATIEDKFSGRIDLTITYSTAPVAPGKYTASITAGSSTASIEFEIAAAALNAEVTLSPETVTYNGSEQKPTVTVAGLTEGKDYTVTFPADMTSAGEKTITVTGKGNYEGVATKTFTIEKASLTAADFTFTAPANLTYDGKAKTASVTTVKTDAAVTVKYSADPVNVGTYTVSIDVAESANYKAASLTDAAWTFSIAPKTVTTPTFFGLEALYLHTGSAIEPTFTLKDGETEIPASEYTVAYSNNVNVGTATVTVSDVAGGNYTVSGTATFAIATHEHVWSYTASGNVITATCSGDLGSCPNKTVTLTVTAASSVYDGAAKSAAVTVDPAGAIAAPAITYSTADGSAPFNAGTYDASITLGDATAKTIFTIEKAELTAADFVFTAPANLVFDGSTKIAKIMCTKTDCVITVKYNADPVNVGTYTVSIDVAQSKNYNNATLSSEDWTFAITPASIASATVAAADQVYTGEELKPAVTVTLGSKTLLEGTDFTVAYSDNVNVGSAKITVTGKGNYEGTANGTFEIKTSGSALTANADKTAYTYGEQIIVTAKAELSQQKRSLFALRAVTPTMALYYGDTKLDEAEVVNGEANLSYMTAGRAFAPADKIELTVRYSGDANMAESETTVSFSMSKKTLTPGLGGSVTKVYDGETTISSADDLFFSVSGTMKGDIPMVKASSFAFADANVGENKAVTASGYTLDETSAKYYALSATEATANVGKITPASIASATVTAAEQVYTGEELKPAVTVTLGGKALTEGTDFTVAYSDNVNVGSAKITVTGKGNYEGTANGTFEIKTSGSALTANADKTAYTYGEQIIVTAKAELSQQKRSLFALRAVTPTMTLYYGDTKLDEAEVVNGEANLSYMTAGRAFAPADKIELTVRYSGDANMAESETTVSFSMSKKTLTPGLGGSVTKVYDGETTISSADDLFFSVSGTMKGDIPMVKASSFAFADANVGENKAVTASGYTLDETSAKYYSLGATEATANVGKITPASIASATVKADNEVYTGAELKPAVTVTLGGKTLLEGTDFTVAYSDNVNVGSAKITVTGKGNYEGTANGTFEIGKARPVTEAPAGLTAVYGDLLSTVALPDHDLGTWNWVNPDVEVGNAGVQTHEVIFVPFDAEQYISVTLSAKVTVTKADMTFGDSFKVLLGDTENTAFTYGDIVTVKAQPRMETPVLMALRAFTAPKANQMALFSGSTQISEAVDPDADGVYTMTYDTSDKALAAGSNTITAKYVGTENLNDFSASAAITIAKRELTITSVKANNRIHKAGNTKVTVTGAEFDGKLSGDDVNIATVKGDVGSDAIGTYTTVTLPELTLIGSDASFYVLKPTDSAATNVEIVAVPADLPVEPELDSFDDTDISDELKDAGFDSTDDITTALKENLDKQLKEDEALNPVPGAQPKEILGTETHNVGIVYNEDGEKIEGDSEHFPQSGMTVLLPIPEGTAPDTHEYYGAFMTGSTNGDQLAGSVVPLTVEVVTGENGEQMLSVEIPGIGQIMIGWVAKAVDLPETGDASNILLWLAMLAISCPAMLFTSKKMKRSMR